MIGLHKEAFPQFTFAPYFQERLDLERKLQEYYRSLQGSNWLHKSGEYRYPIRSIETQSMAQQEKDMQEAKQRGELSQVEQMVKDRVLSAISQRGYAVIVDYGAGRAESLGKIMSSLGEDQDRLVAIATSLKQESNVDGVNFVEGDIDALYAHNITLKDRRAVAIKGSVDVILANHSVQHSFVADAVLPLLGQLAQSNGLVILGHSKQGLLPAIPSAYMGSVDPKIIEAREQAWSLGLNNLRGLGFQLVLHPADSSGVYNYHIYSGDPSVKLPEIKFW